MIKANISKFPQQTLFLRVPSSLWRLRTFIDLVIKTGKQNIAIPASTNYWISVSSDQSLIDQLARQDYYKV